MNKHNTVQIWGVIKGWSFGGNGTNYDPFGIKGDAVASVGDASKLIKVSHWNNLTLGATTGQFPKSDFEITAQDAPDLSETTSLAYAFHQATKFNGDISDWNVSNVMDMTGTFRGATMFNKNMQFWDVSDVESMSHMFYEASSFNQSLANVKPIYNR